MKKNLQGCHVHAIARNYGALTAQNRQSLLEDTGFSFVNCRVTGSGALYLGRAWGTFSRVVFAYTYMDNIIIPRGWYNWGDPTREMYVVTAAPPILLFFRRRCMESMASAVPCGA
jgi:pectinesterase